MTDRIETAKPRPLFSERIQKVTSPGGVTAWLLQDDTVPLVTMSFAFAGGAALDADGKEGTARLVGAMMTYGAGQSDAEQFQAELADRAIQLAFNIEHDFLSGTLACLDRHASEGFRLLGLRLRKPRFDPPAVETVRAMAMSSLRYYSGQPFYRARSLFRAQAYAGHVYGRESGGTLESLAAIAPEDLAALHGRIVSRKGLTIGVVGAIDAERLAAGLDEAFGGLPDAALPVAAPVALASLGQDILSPMDVPNSSIVFGRPALSVDDPDYTAATLVNYRLGGGGFNSRLFDEIRVKRGLCYSIGTNYEFYRSATSLVGETSTPSAVADQTLQLIKSEFARMAHESLTLEELSAAQAYMIGSFDLGLDTSFALVNQFAMLQKLGRDIDWLDRRRERILSVTLEDARRAAGRLLAEGQLLAVMVGAGIQNAS